MPGGNDGLHALKGNSPAVDYVPVAQAHPTTDFFGNQRPDPGSPNEGVWGVGELRVRTAESGELIRFNYRVLDPSKAAALNDKKMEPELYDAQAKVKLTVPQMEKVGKVRQESTPHSGMTYWMAFSNPTLAVKRGHRVDVVIGSFRATNLVVE